jgi:hypothetical protein
MHYGSIVSNFIMTISVNKNLTTLNIHVDEVVIMEILQSLKKVT